MMLETSSLLQDGPNLPRSSEGLIDPVLSLYDVLAPTQTHRKIVLSPPMFWPLGPASEKSGASEMVLLLSKNTSTALPTATFEVGMYPPLMSGRQVRTCSLLIDFKSREKNTSSV